MLAFRSSPAVGEGVKKDPARLVLLVGSSARLSSLCEAVERFRETGELRDSGAMMAVFTATFSSLTGVQSCFELRQVSK